MKLNTALAQSIKKALQSYEDLPLARLSDAMLAMTVGWVMLGPFWVNARAGCDIGINLRMHHSHDTSNQGAHEVAWSTSTR